MKVEDQAVVNLDAYKRSRKRRDDLASAKKMREAIYGAGPTATPEMVDAAIRNLSAQQRQDMLEFLPGTRTKEKGNAYGELAELGLLKGVPRSPPMTMSFWMDGFGFTNLGRAVQERLKAEA